MDLYKNSMKYSKKLWFSLYYCFSKKKTENERSHQCVEFIIRQIIL